MAISKSARVAATAKRVETNQRTGDAITAGIKAAAAQNLTKPYDVGICIKVALDNAGLKIVNKPTKDGLRDFGRK